MNADVVINNLKNMTANEYYRFYNQVKSMLELDNIPMLSKLVAVCTYADTQNKGKKFINKKADFYDTLTEKVADLEMQYGYFDDVSPMEIMSDNKMIEKHQKLVNRALKLFDKLQEDNDLLKRLRKNAEKNLQDMYLPDLEDSGIDEDIYGVYYLYMLSAINTLKLCRYLKSNRP